MKGWAGRDGVAEMQEDKRKKYSVTSSSEVVEIEMENKTEEGENETDILVILFSVTDARSLNNIMLQYLPLAKKDININNPVTNVLVGLNASNRVSTDRKHVSIEQAEQASKGLKSFQYLEIKDESIDTETVIQFISKLVLRNLKTQRNKNSNWLSKLILFEKSLENKEPLPDINLKRCKLEFIPPQIYYFKHSLTVLKLSHNLIRSFPEEILLFDSLEVLGSLSLFSPSLSPFSFPLLPSPPSSPFPFLCSCFFLLSLSSLSISFKLPFLSPFLLSCFFLCFLFCRFSFLLFLLPFSFLNTLRVSAFSLIGASLLLILPVPPPYALRCCCLYSSCFSIPLAFLFFFSCIAFSSSIPRSLFPSPRNSH